MSDDNLKDELDGKSKQIETSEADLASIWVLHIDEASNAQGSGASLFLTNSEGIVTKYTLLFNFKASNNQAEHEALLAGLKIAKKLGINNLKIFIDS